jgi:hypothetical protein
MSLTLLSRTFLGEASALNKYSICLEKERMFICYIIRVVNFYIISQRMGEFHVAYPFSYSNRKQFCRLNTKIAA